MPSTQVTLTGGAISTVQLDAPTGRVVVTQMAGTAAECYTTADGTNPIIPLTGVEVPTNQTYLPATLGSSVVVQPPLFGDHMIISQVRILSAGTPTVLVEW